MKILIADSLDFKTLEEILLHKAAYLHHNDPIPVNIPEHELHFSYQPDISVEDIEKYLGQYHGLIVRPKQITGKAISLAKDLKIIVRGGAGMNSIDLKAASKNKVIVENTPGENSISTAEYTFNMIMELVAQRQIIRSDSDSRSGKADIPEKYYGYELAGKKIAIVGLGNIGMALAKRARAFDMEVIYHSNSMKDIDLIYFKELKHMLEAKADIISLHLPLTEKTEKIIGRDEFALMKQGTILINCARPQLVDPDAFAWALQENILAGAGIDGDPDLIEPFIKADAAKKCLLTHHIADSTLQAQQKITRQVLTQIFAFFREGKIINQFC